ncbi:MAG: HD domain-containing protein [Candidatus Bathyarchaeia archaeon]
MEKRELKRLWEEAEKILPRFGSHSIEHTRRVYLLCLYFGDTLGADLEVLLPAARLHDISRRQGVESHAEESARAAERLLVDLGYQEPKIRETDADKLDALGATGVYRAAAYGGEVGQGLGDFIRHFHEKLLELPDLLYTEPARKMALQRREFMVGYLEQLDRELKLET